VSDLLSRWFPWFFALPSDQQNFLLVVVPVLLTAVATLVPAVRRWIRRVIVWRGSPVKVSMNPYGVRYSAEGKHYIVFPDVTITNRNTEAETVSAELSLEECLEQYKHKHVHKCQPDTAVIPGWEQSQWAKRNSLIRFPLNLDGKRAVHGHIAFCVWNLAGDVPESRNKSELRIIDLATGKTIHHAKQFGPTMLLGGFRAFAKPESLEQLSSALKRFPQIQVIDRARAAREQEERRIRRGDWLDLERRFRELKDQSIEAYCNRIEPPEDPEKWTFRGNDAGRKECEGLCHLAGAMLTRSPGVVRASKVRANTDNASRWLYFLEERDGITKTITGSGLIEGRTYTSKTPFIQRIPEVSARVCVECSALET
jgi:hypothetical protein